MTTPEVVTADEQEKAQLAEYGKYVAKEAINIGTARAFNIGDPVPASHVERGVVALEQVEKTSTKAGQALAAPAPVKES